MKRVALLFAPLLVVLLPGGMRAAKTLPRTRSQAIRQAVVEYLNARQAQNRLGYVVTMDVNVLAMTFERDTARVPPSLRVSRQE